MDQHRNQAASWPPQRRPSDEELWNAHFFDLALPDPVAKPVRQENAPAPLPVQ